jgi:uncharacterized protein YbjT (DUF2867 family)
MTIKRVAGHRWNWQNRQTCRRKAGGRGFEVTIGSRSVASVEKSFQGRIPGIIVEVTDRESLKRALTGFDAVHLNLPSGPTFEDCIRIEAGGAKAVASVAAETGIQRISYILELEWVQLRIFLPQKPNSRLKTPSEPQECL